MIKHSVNAGLDHWCCLDWHFLLSINATADHVEVVTSLVRSKRSHRRVWDSVKQANWCDSLVSFLVSACSRKELNCGICSVLLDISLLLLPSRVDFSLAMEGSWYALINAALFAMQAVVNIVYAKRFVTEARAHETLITPASYALVLWILVYALEAVLVVVDVFAPRYSMFADANQPAQLRLCFSATCVLNTIWVFLYVSGYVYAATVVIYALWLAILVLYVYAVNDRNARETGPFDWILYLCNEVPISMYFAWVTTVAFTHLAMSMQLSNHGYLGFTTYISYLCIVIVLGLLMSRYAQDLIAGLVIVWFLIAVSIKHVHFPQSVQCMDIAVRACAGEGAAIIAAVLAVNRNVLVLACHLWTME